MRSSEYPRVMTTDRPRAATRTLATLNEQGSCVGHPNPDWWFPEQGRDDTDKAMQVCDTCPVRRMCRDYAQTWDERGIWGGVSEPHREQLHERLDEGEWEYLLIPLPGFEDEWLGETA